MCFTWAPYFGLSATIKKQINSSHAQPFYDTLRLRLDFGWVHKCVTRTRESCANFSNVFKVKEKDIDFYIVVKINESRDLRVVGHSHKATPTSLPISSSSSLLLLMITYYYCYVGEMDTRGAGDFLIVIGLRYQLVRTHKHTHTHSHLQAHAYSI